MKEWVKMSLVYNFWLVLLAIAMGVAYARLSSTIIAIIVYLLGQIIINIRCMD